MKQGWLAIASGSEHFTTFWLFAVASFALGDIWAGCQGGIEDLGLLLAEKPVQKPGFA